MLGLGLEDLIPLWEIASDCEVIGVRAVDDAAERQTRLRELVETLVELLHSRRIKVFVGAWQESDPPEIAGEEAETSCVTSGATPSRLRWPRSAPRLLRQRREPAPRRDVTSRPECTLLDKFRASRKPNRYRGGSSALITGHGRACPAGDRPGGDVGSTS